MYVCCFEEPLQLNCTFEKDSFFGDFLMFVCILLVLLCCYGNTEEVKWSIILGIDFGDNRKHIKCYYPQQKVVY